MCVVLIYQNTLHIYPNQLPANVCWYPVPMILEFWFASTNQAHYTCKSIEFLRFECLRFAYPDRRKVIWFKINSIGYTQKKWWKGSDRSQTHSPLCTVYRAMCVCEIGKRFNDGSWWRNDGKLNTYGKREFDEPEESSMRKHIFTNYRAR